MAHDQRSSNLALSPAQLTHRCSIDHFPFKSTAELPPVRDIIGQPRGVRAIEFGIDMLSPGYNIYVMGPRGTGRLTAIERFIQARAAEESIPDDWVYVHNFDAPHQPQAIPLPAGMGRQFCLDMQTVIGRLRSELALAFKSEAFDEKSTRLKRHFDEQRELLLHQLQTMAAQKGFVIRPAEGGMMLAPVKDGQVMSPQDFEALSEAERTAFEERRRVLEEELREAMRRANELETEAREAYQNLLHETAAAILASGFAALHETYADHELVLAYLERVARDILDNINEFMTGPQAEAKAEQAEQEGGQEPGAVQGPRRYQVNLLVDHQDAEGAPVVVVSLPTYQNLIGRIEHQVQYGALTTDFTMIKPGALHLANGGYLVVRAMDILRQPFAWEALKRALQTSAIHIEEPESRGVSVITTQMLEPEPIPLDVKVIMLGSPLLYYALFEAEEDFPELFKVKADFAAWMDRSPDNEALVAVFVATRCHEEGLPHFSADAVGRVVDYATWLAGDQQKLSTRFGEITDLIREAAYFARRDGRDLTTPDDVSRAIDERRFRSNLYEEQARQRILEGDIFIDTEGAVVGQINGLTVVQLGDYAFGLPSRITARVSMGQSDVVQIEREVQMTGPIHDKGVLILRGYLGAMYATDFPLTLSASLTFEQNYGGVEGDSASSTELYALLSALADLPLRQDLAVTGSVNQHGVIQPIGGVTQKIEGFFAVCKARGLTGTQGVLIPAANVHHLMLSDEVVAAVEAGQFHVYAIETIDQGIALLTGVPAGVRGPDGEYPPGTVHYRVRSRLRALAEGMRQFTAPSVTVQTGHAEA
ncbi:MAG: ATP-binding protein [Anaerolineae bacterium]